MQTPQDELTRAVCETLDSVVTPAVRDTLIGEALESAQAPGIPADPAKLRAFLSGPLQEALERALGLELGRSVTRELELVADRLAPASRFTPAPVGKRRGRTGSLRPAKGRPRSNPPPARRPTPIDVPRPSSSKRRPSTLPSAGGVPDAERDSTIPTLVPIPGEVIGRMPTQPARDHAQIPTRRTEPRPGPPTRPPASNDYPAGTSKALGMAISSAPPGRQGRLPVVLVATRDVDLTARFGAWLDPRAAVARVTKLVDLLLDLRGAEQRRVVVVLDCRFPPFLPQALAALAEELPEGLKVLLWGAPSTMAAKLSEISTVARKWILCPPGMADADVVVQCSELLG